MLADVRGSSALTPSGITHVGCQCLRAHQLVNIRLRMVPMLPSVMLYGGLICTVTSQAGMVPAFRCVIFFVTLCNKLELRSALV